MTRNVYVLTCHQNVLKNCLNLLSPQIHNFLIYLGKDVYKSKKIEELTGTIAERVNIGEDLQEFARKYRQDYIDYIGKLSLEYDSPLWFLTSLSEKNPFVSDFFLHFCYVKICQKHILGQPHNLIIVCENRGIFNSLRENLKKNSQINIIFYDSRLSLVIDNLFAFGTRLRNKLVFLFRFLLRVALAKIFSVVTRHFTAIKDNNPVIIMHSWTDSRSFAYKSDYKDVYFGNVGEELEKKGNGFFYLADVLPTMWYPKALYHLRHVNKKIFLMEEFLSFGDVIASLTFVHRNYPKSIKDTFFDDVEVSSLISHEFTKDRSSFRPEQSYLNYFISQRILCHFAVLSFLFTFENHIWEKAFCEGFKKNPKIKTIAYSIVFINRMYTCFSHSRFENRLSPLPDVILVSGKQGKDNLIEFGFDPKKIVVGGAIRYPFIRRVLNSSNTSEKKNVLIALSGAINSSLELIYVSINAFSNTKDINILIKCHPIVPFRLLSKYMPRLPEHFRVVENSIDDLLEITDLVLYTESTVCVEALAKGIPILHIDSTFTIDINIFEKSDMVPSANAPEHIRSIAMEILTSTNFSLDLIQKVIEELFAPVDEQKILSIITAEKEL